MKLNYSQFESHLLSTLAPVYILSGDEVLLKQEALQLLRKAAKHAGFNERLRFVVEANFDWEQLYTALYSSSLLAEKQYIELDCRQTLPSKIADSFLQKYSQQPSMNHLLLINIGKIDDKIAKTSWFQALEKIGVVISIWPVTREQLPQWIIQRAKKYNLSFKPEAAKLLADYVEGNLIAAAQAIEKLYLFKSNTAIDNELVKTILTQENCFNLFDFVENLIAGNTERSLTILDTLQAQNTEPAILLWAIHREFKFLADLSRQVMQGETLENLFKKK